MTTRPIRTTPTIPPNSPRITTDNRDLLNHTPLPNMYRTTPLNPIITLLMVLPLTPFRIQPRRNGMARRGRPRDTRSSPPQSTGTCTRTATSTSTSTSTRASARISYFPSATAQRGDAANCRDTQGR